MNHRSRSSSALLLCLAVSWTFAWGHAEAQAPPRNPHAGIAGTPGAFGMGAEKRPVSESEMTRYLATLDALVKGGAGAGDPRSLTGESAYSDAVMNEISKHGFDPETFGEVHGNVMSAYLALEMKSREAELEAARAEHDARMAEMKAKLSPEQYAAIARSMEGLRAVTRSAENVPPENLALVQKHRAELDRIFERPRRR